MKINGIDVNLARVNVKTIAKIERMGVPFSECEKKPIAFAVGLLAVSLGCSFDKAAEHIQRHLDAGNDVNEFLDGVTSAVQSADVRGL